MKKLVLAAFLLGAVTVFAMAAGQSSGNDGSFTVAAVTMKSPTFAPAVTQVADKDKKTTPVKKPEPKPKSETKPGVKVPPKTKE